MIRIDALLLLPLLCYMTTTTHAADFICNSEADCLPHGSCDANTLTCSCGSGFYGDRCGLTCPLLCQNGGQCKVSDLHGGVGLSGEEEHYCQCPSGVTGSLCQTTPTSNPSAGSAISPVSSPTSYPTSKPASSPTTSVTYDLPGDAPSTLSSTEILVVVMIAVGLVVVGGIIVSVKMVNKNKAARSSETDMAPGVVGAVNDEQNNTDEEDDDSSLPSIL